MNKRPLITFWGFSGIPQKSPENPQNFGLSPSPKCPRHPPKLLPPSPPRNLRFFGDFSPENPRNWSFPHPRIVPEGSARPIPVPTPSPNFGDGDGDPRGSGRRGSSLMMNYISEFKWAWQAQFLSHILVILKNCVFFEDKQMTLVSFFDIFTGFRFQKNLNSLPIQSSLGNVFKIPLSFGKDSH